MEATDETGCEPGMRQDRVEAGDETGNSHLLSEPCLEALGLWTVKK